jgi:uncharacterized protein YciI
MAQFLCCLKATRLGMLTDGPSAAEIDSVTRHFQYWSALTESGCAILVGRTQNLDAETLGLALFNAGNADEAAKIAALDPAVVDGVMAARIFPYQIALFNPSNAS